MSCFEQVLANRCPWWFDLGRASADARCCEYTTSGLKASSKPTTNLMSENHGFAAYTTSQAVYHGPGSNLQRKRERQRSERTRQFSTARPLEAHAIQHEAEGEGAGGLYRSVASLEVPAMITHRPSDPRSRTGDATQTARTNGISGSVSVDANTRICAAKTRGEFLVTCAYSIHNLK